MRAGTCRERWPGVRVRGDEHAGPRGGVECAGAPTRRGGPPGGAVAAARGVSADDTAREARASAARVSPPGPFARRGGDAAGGVTGRRLVVHMAWRGTAPSSTGAGGCRTFSPGAPTVLTPKCGPLRGFGEVVHRCGRMWAGRLRELEDWYWGRPPGGRGLSRGARLTAPHPPPEADVSALGRQTGLCDHRRPAGAAGEGETRMNDGPGIPGRGAPDTGPATTAAHPATTAAHPAIAPHPTPADATVPTATTTDATVPHTTAPAAATPHPATAPHAAAPHPTAAHPSTPAPPHPTPPHRPPRTVAHLRHPPPPPTPPTTPTPATARPLPHPPPPHPPPTPTTPPSASPSSAPSGPGAGPSSCPPGPRSSAPFSPCSSSARAGPPPPPS
ncbi:hypothetical protein GA0115257_10695 [Streptomyces sp. LcepLS]|nr:hypothetical protein GA0115257_10695 [Streptomyces sp. LcepLS]